MPTGSAPVCHISPPVVIKQPPAVQFPAIPPIVGLNNQNNLANILNAMRQFLQILAGEMAYLQTLRNAAMNPPTRPATSGSNQGAQSKQNPSEKKPRWIEQSRQTVKQRITNPADSSQYVDVERITHLTMQDGITGDSWTWKL